MCACSPLIRRIPSAFVIVVLLVPIDGVVADHANRAVGDEEVEHQLHQGAAELETEPPRA